MLLARYTVQQGSVRFKLTEDESATCLFRSCSIIYLWSQTSMHGLRTRAQPSPYPTQTNISQNMKYPAPQRYFISWTFITLNIALLSHLKEHIIILLRICLGPRKAQCCRFYAFNSQKSSSAAKKHRSLKNEERNCFKNNRQKENVKWKNLFVFF